MAIIRCKMCGGDIELSEDKTFGTCDCCGSTMTFPKVSDDQRAAAFNRGNHFRRIGEFDKALAVYERIVQEDDTDAEAHWCCALCRFGIEYVEDPGTFEYMPTCHRASFDSILEDVDYLAALEHSDGITRRQYQKDAAKIAEVQKGILATSQNEEPFDVFICYKESDANGGRTKDSLLAQEIYYQLTDQGRRVFFSRITLEDKVGSQYEPYIFAALNSAKVMIVVGTKEEYLNAVWVKNEWSRFLALMKKDRTKLLLPCYRDMDPYDLPEQLSVLQSYDMSKIGFIQDLTRGISKVLDADKKPVATETVVVTGGNDNTAALLKRGNMALEDGDWAKADDFFEQVLNQNAESAEAYMGKFLASKQASTFGKWAEKYLAQTSQAEMRSREAVEADGNKEAKIVNDYALQGYLAKEELKKLLEFNRTYGSQLFERTKQCNQAKMIFEQDKSLVRAFRFASGGFADEINGVKQNLIDTMNQRCEESREKDEEKAQAIADAYKKHLDDAETKAKELREQAEAKREGDYMQQVEWFEAAAAIDEYKRVQNGFRKLGTYEDCAEYVQKCEDAIGRLKMEAADKAARLKAEQEAEEARLQAELAAEEERKRVIAAKEAAAKKKKMTTMGIIAAAIFVVIIAAVLVVTKVVIPNNNYNQAVALMDNGQHEEAIAAFEALDGYKDSVERIAACEVAIQKAEQEALIAKLSAEYDVAIALMNDGKYEEAMTVFETIESFKDSAELMESCETAIKDTQYDVAMALMNAEKYEEAATAFEAIAGHRDSNEQLQESKYRQALILIKQASYSEAYDLLVTLSGYKDTADYLANYCYLPVYARCASNSSTKDFYITYDQNGKMTGGYRDAFSEKNPVFIFDEKGVLVREEWSSGTDYDYKYHSDGTVEKVPNKGNSVSYYDMYGNKSGYISTDGERVDWTSLTFDEHHNENSKYAQNTYDENGNLVYVYYRMNNYICESEIEYEMFYLTDVDEELAWKNFRMICGDDIW